MLTVEQVEQAISVPVERWKGNCHSISSLLMKAGLVPDGYLCYGHWTGPVAPGGFFTFKVIQRHGWIEREDGSIVDPTRWVFENVDPYIYAGPNDYYDFGGNTFLLENEQPSPRYAESTHEDVKILPVLIQMFFPYEDQPEDRISLDQAFWLANLSLVTLQENAYSVFKELELSGNGALIPMDNRKRVLKK